MHNISLRPYTSQHNGKAERVLHTINYCLRTLLLHSAAPPSFWVEAINTAMFPINHRLCCTTGTVTLHDLLLGTPSRYDELRVCRCLNLSTSMGGTRKKVEGEDRHDLEPEGTREDTRHKIYTGSGSRSSYPTSCLE
jgi:hypothetical protein